VDTPSLITNPPLASRFSLLASQYLFVLAQKTSSYHFIISLGVSLGGFLFGFDAAVISGVTGYIVPEFSLSDIQLGWAVASLTLASSFAMLTVGPLSDRVGRRSLLLLTGLFYAVSALFSALAPSYEILVAARMLGGLAVGAALILAPMYIAETSAPANRGKMVSIQQLNIVLGFSAAYFSNYFLLQLSSDPGSLAISLGLDVAVWRWMLGVEVIPALLFFIAMLFVPRSPRWLMLVGKEREAREVLGRIHSEEVAGVEYEQIKSSVEEKQSNVSIRTLLNPSLRAVLLIGLIVGILQQITGVNAIYFYATNIFEQSGVGKDAAFAQAVWIGIINVVFTLIAMMAIDRLGRKPLLLLGIAGVAISMGLTSYGFSQARFELSSSLIASYPSSVQTPALQQMASVSYESDVAFKRDLKAALGEERFQQYQSQLIKDAIQMNPILILVGILGFVASFALSLGPVMWVLLSELFPNWIRGLAISLVGFANSAVSFLVQLIFPWELTHLGSSLSYLIYAAFAVIGFVLIWRFLPETKGKSLEEIESQYVIEKA